MSAARFQTLSAPEARALLDAPGTRRTSTHNTAGTIGKPPLPWRFCLNCGLLTLKNEVTRRALRAACVWEE